MSELDFARVSLWRGVITQLVMKNNRNGDTRLVMEKTVKIEEIDT